ncbi:MAG: SUMF1/EgtB/PvdO family nonheme iron enzyme [Planctomycetales bacterium]
MMGATADDEEGRNNEKPQHPVTISKPFWPGVGSYQSNAFGLFDLHGNVWEWCSDWLGDYSPEAVTDPTGPALAGYRVLRGGGWSARAVYCRSAPRSEAHPAYRDGGVGFRVVAVQSGK